MPRPTRQHAAIFVRTLAEDLLHQGFSARQIFEGSALGPELLQLERPSAEFADIAAVFENAAALTGDDILGFRRGEVREMRRIGLICYVGLASPTVQDYLRNIAGYRRVFSEAIDIDVSDLTESGLLRWHFDVPSKVAHRQYVEFAASGVLASMRQATGYRIVPQRMSFRHLRNTHLDRIQEYVGCQVQFGTPDNTLTFAAADLRLPLATADNHLYQVLVDYAETVLQRKTYRFSDLLVEVERAIADRLASGGANQDNVSRALGMSPRTLARRLAQEGTTFFKTLEELRKSLAVSYLRNSDLALGEITFLLGYSNLSSFNDAFKRWVGMTPRRYRIKCHRASDCGASPD